MSKQKQHSVIGSGSAPAKVLAEGLSDVLEDGDSVGLIWTGKPTAGQEAVFDYVLDNEVPFTLYYEDGQNPPKVFRESDHGVVQKSRDPMGKALDDTNGSVLFLWDDDENPDLIEVVWGVVHEEGINILELTNGLAPITLEEEDEEVTEAKSRYDDDDDEEEEDEDDTRFTKDELEVMAAAAVKRYGARIGAEATTKKGIIEELFPDDDEEEHNAGHSKRDGDEDEPDEDEVDLSPENMRRTKGDPEADHEQPAPVRRPGSPDKLEQDIEEVLDVIRTFLTAAARGEYSN